VSHAVLRPTHSRAVLEGTTTGVGVACALVVVGALAMASFEPNELARPYWVRIGWLRTDTFGALCFFVAVVAFVTSEYLRLARRAGDPAEGTDPAEVGTVVTLAVARTLVVAATTLVVYLSVNAITHPRTLALPATHLLSWPSEGTTRMAALVVVAIAVSVARALGITIHPEERRVRSWANR
jgi:hypothetical protein